MSHLNKNEHLDVSVGVVEKKNFLCVEKCPILLSFYLWNTMKPFLISQRFIFNVKKKSYLSKDSLSLNLAQLLP